MKTFNTKSLFAFFLTAMVAAMYAAPASAMGRSAAMASKESHSSHAKESLSKKDTDVQTQINTLQKELDALKAQIALAKNASIEE